MPPSRSVRLASTIGRISLVRARSGALVYRQRGGNQSAVDAAGVSIDTYIHVLYGLLLQTAARKVLMIGCGGGLLGTMLTRAGKRVSVVDIDPVTFSLARRYFKLPRAIDCHVADGLGFLQRTRRRFDAIVLDAFVGEDIPAQFLGDDFAAAARRCLAPDGALLVNVCLGRGQDTADRLARVLRRVGWPVRLLDRRVGERNAIVMAGKVRGLRPPRLIVSPSIEVTRLRAELGGMSFRRIRKAKTKRASQ